MIQSANVMNRGAGSDTQGCALPKFITDVSLGDRAPFKRASAPGLCFFSETGNECWREEDTITRCQSTELSSVLALPFLKKHQETHGYDAAAMSLGERKENFSLEEELKKEFSLHMHTYICNMTCLSTVFWWRLWFDWLSACQCTGGLACEAN